jgi:hypothetical protein
MNPHADSVQQPSDTEWAKQMLAVAKEPWTARSVDSLQKLLAETADRLARFGTRPAAEPSQSGSAGEADWSKIESIVDEFVDGYEMIGETADGRDACYTPNERERLLLRDCIAGLLAEPEFLAALSRQAPAAPAAVDFEKWWLAEVAANGGVPVGADYKHWAKKGFELRGEAEAMALLGWTRYEKARKLNPAQWAELHQRNLRGENFDGMIDALPATTQPVQQDTKPLNGIPATMFHDEGAIAQCNHCGRYSLDRKTLSERDSDQPVCECGKQHWWSGSFKKPGPDAKWSGATPPAEKQAAPSGEGEA